MSKVPKNPMIPSVSLLKGCYAYSYTAYWRAVPAYKKETPHLAAFYESPLSLKNFTQVPGYAVGSFAGYVCFDGAGKLQGKGKANIGGENPIDVSYTGSYTVAIDTATGVITGTFQTMAGQSDFINHYFVMADNWKQLVFTITDTYLRKPVTSGCMIKI